MKKAMLLLFITLSLLILLVACGTPEETTVPAAVGTTAPITTVTEVTTVATTTAGPTTPTVNGTPLGEYTIVANENATAEAEMLAEMLAAEYGITLPISTEDTGKSIILRSSTSCALNKATVAPSGDDVILRGRGVNGPYLGARAFYNLMKRSGGTLTLSADVTENVGAYLNIASADFLNAYARPDSSADGELNVVFLGGSLTQDKTAWTQPVADYLQQLFRKMTINTINAGIGATDSEFGAARFEKDVLAKMPEPDIIFIDFAVNDGGYNGATPSETDIIRNAVYLEGIIKQCRELETPPVIILLYNPLGQRAGGSGHAKWANGVALKETLAEHYGIGTIDIWDFFEQRYLAACETDPGLTYDTFLSRYYASTDLVHPMNTGFAVYAEAILAAISKDYEKFFLNKVYADTCFADYEWISELSYELVPLSDTDALTIEGNGTHYTATAFTSDDPRFVPGIRIGASQLSDGVVQFDDGEPFSIRLTTSASVVKLYGINSPKGMTLDVFCDGEFVGTIATCQNNTYLYMHGVTLPQNGNEVHEVEIKPSPNTGENNVFRAGYVVLGFQE